MPYSAVNIKEIKATSSYDQIKHEFIFIKDETIVQNPRNKHQESNKDVVLFNLCR